MTFDFWPLPPKQKGRALKKQGGVRLHCYDTLATIKSGASACVALGYFDGVHLGHRRVLARTVEAARQCGCTSAVFTFAPPLDRAVKGKTILTPGEKARRIAALGVEHYVRPPFEEFCTLSPEAFVHDVLAVRFGAKAVFCGDNFTFGSHKAGDVDTLRSLCAAAGISVEIVPMVQWGDAPVSSSRIRASLEAGDVKTASAMLGEPYCIDLPVRHGQRLGTTLGFPTINQIYPDWMLLPRQGVYVTQVLLDGVWRPSATGLGTRPTVSGTGVTCETFIPDFSGDIYGDTVPVRFCRFLWPTQRFDTLEELSAMVSRAAQAAREWRPE